MAVEVLLFEPRLLGALDTCSGPADRGEGRSTEGGGRQVGGSPRAGWPRGLAGRGLCLWAFCLTQHPLPTPLPDFAPRDVAPQGSGKSLSGTETLETLHLCRRETRSRPARE